MASFSNGQANIGGGGSYQTPFTLEEQSNSSDITNVGVFLALQVIERLQYLTLGMPSNISLQLFPTMGLKVYRRRYSHGPMTSIMKLKSDF